jgi:hypothetical protein
MKTPKIVLFIHKNFILPVAVKMLRRTQPTAYILQPRHNICYSSVVQNNDEDAVTEFLILISGCKKDTKYIITLFISNDTFLFVLCLRFLSLSSHAYVTCRLSRHTFDNTC